MQIRGQQSARRTYAAIRLAFVNNSQELEAASDPAAGCKDCETHAYARACINNAQRRPRAVHKFADCVSLTTRRKIDERHPGTFSQT